YQNQPVVKDPSPSTQGPQQATNMLTTGEPIQVRRVQTWSYEEEGTSSQPEAFTTRGRQDEQLTVILCEEVNRQYELLRPPRQQQERLVISSSRPPTLIFPEPMVQPHSQLILPASPYPNYAGANDHQISSAPSYPYGSGASNPHMITPSRSYTGAS